MLRLVKIDEIESFHTNKILGMIWFYQMLIK